MRKRFCGMASALMLVFVLFACKGTAQGTASDSEERVLVYGVKSGYYKTEMPMSESVAETWFDDYGNLQYLVIKTADDTIKSYKIVRDGLEYYYSDYDKIGIKKEVKYIDYREWERAKISELESMGISRLPNQMLFGRSCMSYYLHSQFPAAMSFWKGILMLHILDDGTVLSEVVDLRETAVPSNMFDLPSDYIFVDDPEAAPNDTVI